MKPWMKVLMWLGLGGGIGFFAGYQIGTKATEKRIGEADDVLWNNAYNEGYSDCEKEHEKPDDGNAALIESFNHVQRMIDTYAGRDENDVSNKITLDELLGKGEEDPEMPEEPPVIGDEADIEEIPELHPQHMIQRQVTEEYFYKNPDGFDQENLLYYELDNTLYNKDTRTAIDKPDDIDQVLGIGMLTNFHMKGADLDTIFVENSTMGMLFRIDRIEEAFSDILGGSAEEYEEDDTE